MSLGLQQLGWERGILCHPLLGPVCHRQPPYTHHLTSHSFSLLEPYCICTARCQGNICSSFQYICIIRVMCMNNLQLYVAAQCVTLAPLTKSFPVGGADPAPEPLCRCSVQPVGRQRGPALRHQGVHISVCMVVSVYIYIYICIQCRKMGFYGSRGRADQKSQRLKCLILLGSILALFMQKL